MPSINTAVADLANGTIVGIAAKPQSHQTTMDRTISDTCRVKYGFVHMKASITSSNRLNFAAAAQTPDFNGTYVHFEDAWTTVGNMDINRWLLASGNFSGCEYAIYRVGMGEYRCTHIARPAGVGADALVNLLASYAGQKSWTLVRSVSTAGLIGNNGCAEVVIVSQLIVGTSIDTIRLQIDNTGLVVGHTVWSDPL